MENLCNMNHDLFTPPFHLYSTFYLSFFSFNHIINQSHFFFFSIFYRYFSFQNLNHTSKEFKESVNGSMELYPSSIWTEQVLFNSIFVLLDEKISFHNYMVHSHCLHISMVYNLLGRVYSIMINFCLTCGRIVHMNLRIGNGVELELASFLGGH